MLKQQLISQGINLQINKQSIDIKLTKTELSSIIAEALTDESAGASIKRILNPYLADSFPQFPDFNSVTLGSTAEDGSTTVTLKIKTPKPESAAEEPESAPID